VAIKCVIFVVAKQKIFFYTETESSLLSQHSGQILQCKST